MNSTPHDVDVLLGLSEDELYEELGDALFGETIGFGGADPIRIRRAAERWLEEQKERVREAICPLPIARSTTDAEKTRRATEVATIVDVLITLYGKPAGTVAAVILWQRGIHALCADWEPRIPAGGAE